MFLLLNKPNSQDILKSSNYYSIYIVNKKTGKKEKVWVEDTNNNSNYNKEYPNKITPEYRILSQKEVEQIFKIPNINLMLS